MSTFAAAVARVKDGWTASEFELGGLTDIEEVADRLRDMDPDADLALLFVETDDEYLAIVRVDDSDDLRVFGSDSAFGEETRVGALLLGDIDTPALGLDDLDSSEEEPGDEDDEGDRPAADPDADPIGDPELLADLGISGSRLLALCASEGMMPSDVTSAICVKLGCADEWEELHDS